VHAVHVTEKNIDKKGQRLGVTGSSGVLSQEAGFGKAMEEQGYPIKSFRSDIKRIFRTYFEAGFVTDEKKEVAEEDDSDAEDRDPCDNEPIQTPAKKQMEVGVPLGGSSFLSAIFVTMVHVSSAVLYSPCSHLQL
jgi:hypothetical protein